MLLVVQAGVNYAMQILDVMKIGGLLFDSGWTVQVYTVWGLGVHTY